MRKVFFLLIFFTFLFIFNNSVFAHPGRTAADGCHYCRTNCDSWGVPWNERHCHGGGTVQGVQESVPVYNPSTNKPVPTNIPTPSNTPAPTTTVTPNPTKIISVSPKAKVNKVNKTNKSNKQSVKKKAFWQWLFGK